MIGIHQHAGGFSDRWAAYCTEKQIPFRLIDCLSTNVIAECRQLSAILWHWRHDTPEHLLAARHVLTALEAMGIPVFPNAATSWHYDDKIAQKYLLEAIDAPLIPTWVFYNHKDASDWIAQATWPKVFKLRRGAGSAHVKLVRSQAQALSLSRKAFAGGFSSASSYLGDLGNRVKKSKKSGNVLEKLGRAPRTIWNNIMLHRRMPREQGYIYFQEFLPGNEHDTRITVIGERAFGFTRKNRPNDFRASGSGRIEYGTGNIPKSFVETAFAVTERMGAQSVAFDLLAGQGGKPQIGEVSYCYNAKAIYDCEGHWNRSLQWRTGHMWPEDAILDDLLRKIK